jgi:hypothetical protein
MHIVDVVEIFVANSKVVFSIELVVVVDSMVGTLVFVPFSIIDKFELIESTKVYLKN